MSQGLEPCRQRLTKSGSDGDGKTKIEHGAKMPDEQNGATFQEDSRNDRRGDADNDVSPSGGIGEGTGQHAALVQDEKSYPGQNSPDVKQSKRVEFEAARPATGAGAQDQRQKIQECNGGDEILRIGNGNVAGQRREADGYGQQYPDSDDASGYRAFSCRHEEGLV